MLLLVGRRGLHVEVLLLVHVAALWLVEGLVVVVVLGLRVVHGGGGGEEGGDGRGRQLEQQVRGVVEQAGRGRRDGVQLLEHAVLQLDVGLDEGLCGTSRQASGRLHTYIPDG